MCSGVIFRLPALDDRRKVEKRRLIDWNDLARVLILNG